MAKFKRYDYSQKVLIPVSLQEQLVPGSLEFAIHTLIETRMDMTVFEGNFKNDAVGRSAYDPKILLKVVVLGYARGLISSRDIERACCENVTFMALSGNQRPDHSTIAAFVSSMQEQILSLYCDILLVCEQEGLLGGTFFALDGVKLPANASKESSGTVATLKKKRRKIQQKLKRLLKDQIDADKDDDDNFPNPPNREQQIDKLQKQADRIEKWLKQNDAKIGVNKKELLSNVTDNDSAKMYTAHGTVQGYNAQALVDSKHQVIVHGEAIGKGQDNDNLAPVIDGAKKHLERIGKGSNYFQGKILTADSSYHSVTNIAKCNEEKLDAYIPDNKFRNRDKRFAGQVGYRRRSKKFTFADFKYDGGKDEYMCPNGKRLKPLVKSGRHKGKLLKVYTSRQKDCKRCQLRAKCLRYKDAKRRHFTYYVDASGNNISQAMVQKIQTQKGRKIYPQRIGIVEPVFANIRVHKGMNKFTLRGKIKVNIQWLLYCMVHNVEKIANYGFT
jgi:transposase